VNLDRPERDRFARYLGALIGQGTAREPSAPSVPSVPSVPSALDELALFTAVHFVGQTRHAEGLAKVLQTAFGVPVIIEELVGQWLQIPDDYCWRVPSQEQAAGTPIGVLGESSRVGTQVWDRQSKFRVVVGPLGAEDYARFLPDGEYLKPLIELVARYAGPELAWDIRLVLSEPDRRAAIVGIAGVVGRTAHLGGSGGDAQAFEDLVLDPLEHS